MKFTRYALCALSSMLFAITVNADPVQTQNTEAASPQAQRAGAQSPRAGSNVQQGRTGGSVAGAQGASATPSRAVASRTQQGARTQTAPTGQSRAVAQRSNPARTADGRAVRARVGVAQSSTRVGVAGQVMRAPTGGTNVSSYNSLYSKLYTGTFSNIIDPTTGLISADAYANCLDSYYACMDEICTARNPSQRRCACAGRVLTFNAAEQTLQRAREDLLKVSGELSLLIATKGKDITAAFTLTDAEKALNCVAYRDAYTGGRLTEWCIANPLLSGKFDEASCQGFNTTPPFVSEYCTNNDFGWGSNWMNTLNGADSDILSALQTYAANISNLDTITQNNNDILSGVIGNMNQILNQLNGTSIVFGNAETTVDQLAKTWGYDLFAYAHNNVCNRVLDACFNGIYETCGALNTASNKCKTTSSSGGSGPYNYNSCIEVNNQDGVEFIKPQNSVSAAAACYGYTSNTGDPYSSLRGPVADARRSILNKYVLDANADCDQYGEELKKQTQNMAYQKIAATQLLQKKRLEFKQEEDQAFITDSTAAKTNFSQCLSEILDCYTTQETSYPAWSTSRIKTYCAQIANIPHCYQQMICNPPNFNVAAVIDLPDAQTCDNDVDPRKNTCRNIVTLNEILNGITGTKQSETQREACLQAAFVPDIRSWIKTP